MIKWLISKSKRIQYWIVREAFTRYYGDFIYPFETSDIKISKMNANQQYEYYQSVSDWVQSVGYDVEMQGITRDFYRELAMKTTSETEKSGYRLALIFLKNYQDRLRTQYEQFEVLKANKRKRAKIK